MASALGYVWLGVALVCVLDAMLHSASQWTAADRNRWFWVIFLTVLGPLFLVPYLVGVRPGFARARIVSDEFRIC